MKCRYAAGAALALILTAPGSYASADPRHDGGVIAYTSDRDTPADATEFIDEVYLLDPQTRAVQRMTNDRPGVEHWPTVSPDGRSLAWVRFIFDDSGPRQDLSEIYRCDLRYRAGSWSCHRPRKIVGPVQDNGITWTPDSRSILYSGPLTTDGDFDADIYAVDVRSRKTTNLTQEAVADGIQVQNSQPTVSPDGRFFVYSRGSTGPTRADLYQRNIDGTHPVQLTAAPGNDIAADYSPDGERLAFHGTRDGDADIYTMNADVEGPDNPAANLTNDLQPPNVAHPSQERTPSFSPDGRHIAFWWFADPNTGFPFGFADGEIYSMRTDGSGVRNLTDNNPTDPAARTTGDIHPDWGPSPTRGRHH